MSVIKSALTQNNFLLYGSIRILFACILMSFAVWGIYSLYFSDESQKPRAQATVIDNQEHTLGSGTSSEQTVYTPVLKYVVNGNTYETTSGVQAKLQPYALGSKVEIRYEPSNPEDIFQAATSRNYTLLLIAAAIALPGIGLLVKTVRQILVIKRAAHAVSRS